VNGPAFGHEKRTALRDLLSKEQVFAPCIWDCMTARAAEVTGFKATLLSGGALADSLAGVPDIALLNVEELIWATDRIARYSPLPLIVDADDGYGETPLHAYHTTMRLARAGAMGLTLDDTTGVRGWQRWGQKLVAGEKDGAEGTYIHPVVSQDLWLAKVKASLAAAEGTDCVVIARTEAKLQFGLDEAIERCVRALDLGAEMTLIIGLKSLAECEKVAEKVPGWKMYPDVMSKNGVPDVRLEDVAALGFNLVTMHYLEKASMFGMLDYGKHVIAEGSTIYADDHDMGGLTPAEKATAHSLHNTWWLEAEKDFKKI
jgi:2-methylisocitrate lyase-like PEP mutase family enzyme